MLGNTPKNIDPAQKADSEMGSRVDFTRVRRVFMLQCNTSLDNRLVRRNITNSEVPEQSDIDLNILSSGLPRTNSNRLQDPEGRPR